MSKLGKFFKLTRQSSKLISLMISYDLGNGLFWSCEHRNRSDDTYCIFKKRIKGLEFGVIKGVHNNFKDTVG